MGVSVLVVVSVGASTGQPNTGTGTNTQKQAKPHPRIVEGKWFRLSRFRFWVLGGRFRAAICPEPETTFVVAGPLHYDLL